MPGPAAGAIADLSGKVWAWYCLDLQVPAAGARVLGACSALHPDTGHCGSTAQICGRLEEAPIRPKVVVMVPTCTQTGQDRLWMEGQH